MVVLVQKLMAVLVVIVAIFSFSTIHNFWKLPSYFFVVNADGAATTASLSLQSRQRHSGRGTRTTGAGSHKKTPLFSSPWHPHDKPYHVTDASPYRHDGMLTETLWAAIDYGDSNVSGDDSDRYVKSATTSASSLFLFRRRSSSSFLSSSHEQKERLNQTMHGIGEQWDCLSFSRKFVGDGELSNANVISIRTYTNTTLLGELSAAVRAVLLRSNASETTKSLTLSSSKYTSSGHQCQRKHCSKKKKHLEKNETGSTAGTIVVVPVEGIYGVYDLPSGPHLVLILESEEVYKSPPPPPFSYLPRPPVISSLPIDSASTKESLPIPSFHPSKPLYSPPLLNIRRVVRMDIVPISSSKAKKKKTKTKLTSSQRREEARQLRLLRKALRAHDLYFTPLSSLSCGSLYEGMERGAVDSGTGGIGVSSSNCISSDVTQTLQRALLFRHASTSPQPVAFPGGQKEHGPSQTGGGRRMEGIDWKVPPDTRFFWNEDLISPLYEGLDCDSDCVDDDIGKKSIITNGKVVADGSESMSKHDYKSKRLAVRQLLDSWIVPCTSAFVGVTRDISLSSSVRDDGMKTVAGVVGGGDGVSRNVKSPNKLVYDQILISRRSRFRAGTRFTRRGADATGSVANFAETEQIVLLKEEIEVPDEAEFPSRELATVAVKSGLNTVVPFYTKNGTSCSDSKKNKTLAFFLSEVYSHVQTRGSIPLRWSSPADVRTYAPRVRIGLDPMAHARALRSHILEQLRLYVLSPFLPLPLSPNSAATATAKITGGCDRGLAWKIGRRGGTNLRKTGGSDDESTTMMLPIPKLTFVNLVDKKNDQGRLGKAFDAVLDAVLEVYGGEGQGSSQSPSAGTQHENLGRRERKRESKGQRQKQLNHDQNKNNIRKDYGGANRGRGVISGNNGITWGVASSILSSPGLVRHIWYDFHAECKGGKYHQLKNLLNEVKPDIDGQGYLCAVPVGTGHKMLWDIVSVQNGVVRTNCMDCLDRTNVVQSIFGRYVLFRQLQDRVGRMEGLLSRNVLSMVSGSAAIKNSEVGLGNNPLRTTTPSRTRNLPLEWVVASKQNPLHIPWTIGESSHRNLWADNADAISRLYAGTRALKGDFTRTGKRTKRGALDDGMNSLTRYYLNNFADADRQEGVDLMIGLVPFANSQRAAEEEAKGGGGGIIPSAVVDAATLRYDERVQLLDAINEGRGGARVAEEDMRTQPRSMDSSAAEGSRRRSLGPKKKKSQQHELRLRWLPGDLKGQVKGSSSSSSPLSFSPSSSSSEDDDESALKVSTLAAIDRRAGSDLPWWVVEHEGMEDMEDETKDREGGKEKDNDDDSGYALINVEHTPYSGYFALSILLAIIRAPTFIAILIVCTLLPGITARGQGSDR